MPFDGKDFNRPDLSMPSLEGLSHVLRRPDLRVGFQFDYSIPCRCAMGLAVRLWRVNGVHTPHQTIMAEVFRIPQKAADAIFWELGGPNHIRDAQIKPEHVADAIDAYLAKQP